MNNSHAINTQRRGIVVAIAATAAFGSALGQSTYPNKPIKLVVPFAPGGSNDNIARVIATQLSKRLGQSIVVENKGGGGGTLGANSVAKSAADGYTLLLMSSSLTTQAATSKKLPFAPEKDLEAIGKIGTGAFVVVVSPKSHIKSLAELVAQARAQSRSIRFGSAGIGGINHLGSELLASAAKIELLHVPYKGIGLAFSDLIGGQIQMLLPTIASAVPHIKAGNMRPLAVTSANRSPQLPEVPTVAETGVPGYDLEIWWGLTGPAGMPKPVVALLNQELNKVLLSDEVKTLLAREGAEPQPTTPQQLGELIRSDIQRWTQLLKDSPILRLSASR